MSWPTSVLVAEKTKVNMLPDCLAAIGVELLSCKQDQEGKNFECNYCGSPVLLFTLNDPRLSGMKVDDWAIGILIDEFRLPTGSPLALLQDALCFSGFRLLFGPKEFRRVEFQRVTSQGFRTLSDNIHRRLDAVSLQVEVVVHSHCLTFTVNSPRYPVSGGVGLCAEDSLVSTFFGVNFPKLPSLLFGDRVVSDITHGLKEAITASAVTPSN